MNTNLHDGIFMYRCISENVSDPKNQIENNIVFRNIGYESMIILELTRNAAQPNRRSNNRKKIKQYR